MTDPLWKGLLNWTLKNAVTTTDSTENPSKFKKMSKEDLDFLTKALESTKEAEKQIENAIKNTASFAKGEFTMEDDQIMDNLYVIEAYLDDHPAHSLDIAKNEILNTLMKLIGYSNMAIAKLALQILTSALGNNEIVAKEAFNRGLLDKLFDRIDGLEDISPIVSTMSALVSSYPQSGLDFSKNKRFSLLNSIFTNDTTTKNTQRTREKAAMLIYHLANNKAIDSSLLDLNGIIAATLPFKDETLQFREIFAEMLLSIIQNYPKDIDKVQLSELLHSDSSKWDSEALQQQMKQVEDFLRDI